MMITVSPGWIRATQSWSSNASSSEYSHQLYSSLGDSTSYSSLQRFIFFDHIPSVSFCQGQIFVFLCLSDI